MHNKTLLVLDDDDIFHHLMKLANKPNFFKEVIHYDQVGELISDLLENQCTAALLPDVIFVDIALPVRDGYSFLDAFATLRPSLCKEISIYVVTVSVRQVDHERVAAYPFIKEYITKPVSMNQFRNIAAA
ncbi:response regulator [Mucilaginibacter corticis]|uniref:Response regulator n=1 Tax=Mucilaginibacter corticis TaxID=2597670 RepID=A0A556M9R0_9SPHI|nr:response regulator [Mucilaginibacter corticis]TSJ36633.1 response regulator [Mucilaginibacter corticis]